MSETAINNRFSVAALTGKLNESFKKSPLYSNLILSGEVTSFNIWSSGHIYFTLRDYDKDAIINCIMWKGHADKNKTPIRDFKVGDAVELLGGLDLFLPKGELKFQARCIQVDAERVGQAALNLKLLTERLHKEGVFEKNRQVRGIPSRIAVVTSQGGAVFHDIKTTLERRYPLAVIYPFWTRVQGADAPESIGMAIARADTINADVLIVARGGGSKEDLSAFNDERVARTVYSCRTVVISAVGHETDWSLCDYAADLRAPTPTGAAELASPRDVASISAHLDGLSAHLSGLVRRKLQVTVQRLENQKSRVISPEQYIARQKNHLNYCAVTVARTIQTTMSRKAAQLSELSNVTDALSPYNVFRRGFAAVRKDGTAITTAQAVALGDTVEILLSKGKLSASITGITD
ncbi:MAG: exodeoxyribonuclease VII large subunit [Oscillospiraceae bacterium]|jgi:exodeoxyribonuclease VII large subunit|nr:exodeoxyribonuclease VII large subunit [Oscillospiraceae bacterium]